MMKAVRKRKCPLRVGRGEKVYAGLEWGGYARKHRLELNSGSSS